MGTNDDDKTTPFIRDDDAPGKPAVDPSIHRSGSPAPPPVSVSSGAMFNNFKAAKNIKLPKWAGPLLMATAIFHVALFLAMWAKSIWDIEQLERPKTTVDLAVAPPPPPPPPPPPGGAKPQTQIITPKKIKVKDIVQPVKIEKQEQQVVENSGPILDSDEYCDPSSEECGTEPGGVKGSPGGGPPPPPPPPPPPAPPQNVPPTVLEGSRIAGEKQIYPNDVTKTEIQRSGKDKIVGSFKLCIDANGSITSVNQLKSTGFPAYDQKITSEIRSTWKYKPYAVNGRAVPVCTAVTFIYSQK